MSQKSRKILAEPDSEYQSLLEAIILPVDVYERLAISGALDEPYTAKDGFVTLAKEQARLYCNGTSYARYFLALKHLAVSYNFASLLRC